MSNTPIKKSFLFKLSPPFIRRLVPPNLLNVPRYIIANKCSIVNVQLYFFIKEIIQYFKKYVYWTFFALINRIKCYNYH